MYYVITKFYFYLKRITKYNKTIKNHLYDIQKEMFNMLIILNILIKDKGYRFYLYLLRVNKNNMIKKYLTNIICNDEFVCFLIYLYISAILSTFLI